MSIIKNCDFCGSEAPIKRRFKEKKYCGSCYSFLFIKAQCNKCNEIKRIWRYYSFPICQQCENKQPCFRCGKEQYKLGKIAKDGPVCSSCAKYYTLKICSLCNRVSTSVAKRLKYNEYEPICSACFAKKHFKTCFLCKDKHEPYFTNESRDNYCKRCTIIGHKLCIHCKSTIPAGKRGRLCGDCQIKQSIAIKTQYYQSNLSSQTANLFVQFMDWVICEYSYNRILKAIKSYYECFLIIEKVDNLSLIQGTLLKQYPIQSKPILIYLKKINMIQVSDTLKKDIDNQRYIDNQMKELPYEHQLYNLLQSYYEFLIEKSTQGKTTYYSIRLALTPAKDFLKMAIDQNSELTTALLTQYLWLSSGQRSAITGFINFLNYNKNIQVQLPSKKKYALRKIKQPRLYYEKKLIIELRKLDTNESDYVINKKKLALILKLSLNAIHEVHVPNSLMIPQQKINKKQRTISVCGRNFYLGKIIQKLYKL